MLVKDYMTRHPILIEPNKGVTDAQRLMAENSIRHLPVVGDGKRLLGLVTPQRLAIHPHQLASLDVWEITRYLSNLTVADVMIGGKDLNTIAPDATIEEAAEMLTRHKLSGLPVVEQPGDVVVGIITETDLLVELQNLLGAISPGWRVVMRVPDRLGELRQLVRVIGDRGWGIMAMGSVRSPKDPTRWDIILKVRHCGREELIEALKTIPDQEIVDIREARARGEAAPGQ
jgi:acetoin utilization protein AcuB